MGINFLNLLKNLKKKNFEIERKFLSSAEKLDKIITDVEKILKVDELEQFYLSYGNPEERYRKVLSEDGSVTFLRTYKNEGNEERIEKEAEISSEEYLEALSKNEDEAILSKTRYYIKHEEEDLKEIIIDEYHDDLEGLYVSEAEFKTKEASQNFTPLEFMGEEITDDKEFKNKQLAKLIAEHGENSLDVLLQNHTESVDIEM